MRRPPPGLALPDEGLTNEEAKTFLMDVQHPSAPPHASLRIAGKRPAHHSSGVVHVNTRHTSRFAVIGNHLAQHEELPLPALSTALRDMPEDLVNPVVEFTAQGLGNRPAASIWRNLVAVDLSFYTSPLSDGIRAESRAEDILFILEKRGITIPDGVRQRVNDCEDPEIMRSWLARALTAATAEEIFGDA